MSLPLAWLSRTSGPTVSMRLPLSSVVTCGEDFIHLKYMRNGHEIEHHAPFDRVLFPIRSPSPSPGFWDMLSFGTTRWAVAPPYLSTRTRSDRHFPDLAGACARGGGGWLTANRWRLPSVLSVKHQQHTAVGRQPPLIDQPTAVGGRPFQPMSSLFLGLSPTHEPPAMHTATPRCRDTDIARTLTAFICSASSTALPRVACFLSLLPLPAPLAIRA